MYYILYYILCIIDYLSYTIYYMLHIIYYVLSTIYYTLYIVNYIVCTIYYIGDDHILCKEGKAKEVAVWQLIQIEVCGYPYHKSLTVSGIY